MSNLNALKTGCFFCVRFFFFLSVCLFCFVCLFFRKNLGSEAKIWGVHTFYVGRSHSPSESDLKLSRLLHDTLVVCSKNSKL